MGCASGLLSAAEKAGPRGYNAHALKGLHLEHLSQNGLSQNGYGQSTACCADESTLASKANRPEDAKQKSGGVPSSLLTKVKAVGFLWLGLCNALCAKPPWVV